MEKTRRVVALASLMALFSLHTPCLPENAAATPPPAPIGDYTLYQLVLEDAVRKSEPGGLVAYPILANLHCVNGKIVGGWLDGRASGLRRFRRTGPSMVLPKGLRVHAGRIHGLLSIVSCWNQYDFRIDGVLTGGRINGFYENIQGGSPEGEQHIRGEVSIPTRNLSQEDGIYSLRLNDVLGKADLGVTCASCT